MSVPWPDDEPEEMRLAERHLMSGTAMVARNSGDGQPSPGRPRLVDEELADQLLGSMTRPRGAAAGAAKDHDRGVGFGSGARNDRLAVGPATSRRGMLG